MCKSSFSRVLNVTTSALTVLAMAMATPAAAERPGVGSAALNAMREANSQSSRGIAGRPGVNSNRQTPVQVQTSQPSRVSTSNRGGYSTRYGFSIGGRPHYGSSGYYNYSHSNYNRYYGYNNYGGRGYSSSGAYIAGGILLGSWLSSYNRNYNRGYSRYDPYYYDRYSHDRYYSSYPRTSVRYYQSIPVEPEVVYREKIVDNLTAREEHEPHMLKDMEGKCYDVSFSSSGQELRVQVPAGRCDW